MAPSDKPEFLRVLNGLASIKRVDLTPEALDLWWSAHADWEIEDFRAAASQLVKTCQFMPSPKDFEELRKAARPTSGEAWVKALDHASSGNYRVQGNMGEPLIDRVVRALGGYQVIAMCSDDKLGFLERRFCEHYESMSDAEDMREALPQIAGPPQTRKLSGPKQAAQMLPILARAKH